LYLESFSFIGLILTKILSELDGTLLKNPEGTKQLSKTLFYRAKRDKKRKKYTKTTEYFFERYEIKE